MPSQRIRYKQIAENVFESVQTFTHPHNGAQYIVRISPDMWRILDAETEMPAITGHITSKAADQKKIKEALKVLEIPMHAERRKPRTKKTQQLEG